MNVHYIFIYNLYILFSLCKYLYVGDPTRAYVTKRRYSGRISPSCTHRINRKPSHPIKSGSYPKSTVHCHLVVTHYTSWLLLHSFETTPLKVTLPNMRGAHRWGPHDPGPPYLLLAFANYLYMYTTILRTNKRCTASPLLNVVFLFSYHKFD